MSDVLEYQLYDWVEDHEVDQEAAGSDNEDQPEGKYIIHTFGRCMDGKSVYAKVVGFEPYFYILLPKKFQERPSSLLTPVITELKNKLLGKECKVFYKYKKTLIDIKLIRRKKAEGFTNDKLFYFAKLIFNNAEGMKKYKTFLENNELLLAELTKPHKFKLYEANVLPMIRCFHIRNISGCAWVQVSDYDLIEGDDKESKCDIEIRVNYKKLNPIKKYDNAPFRIASFDIECNSIDGEFPQAKRPGDCIIQIGVTYTYIGQSKPYRQYIACLNNTSSVENTIVESYQTEKELLLGFLEEITNNDCDIMTGYNIFYFDEKYMHDRCKLLGIDEDMSFMSKLKNYSSKFEEKKLASSALGENLLSYWNTPGRIHIDLMKDVQKTFTLSCYKLDYVSSYFIRGDILKYEINNDTIELYCKSVQDIYPNDYVHVEINKGFISDEVGDKYLIEDVDTANKKLIIKADDTLIDELTTLSNQNSKWKLFWAQAKDDVGPKDIFRLQKGTDDDRAIVAKYCIKDCKLVNLLINKLEVITKNIEMANVCYVPLSYLFIRGQGVKIFSLCLKEFREQKYIFPVVKMNKLYKCLNCEHEFLNLWNCPKCKENKKEEIETESYKYEGAIVFDPVPKVEYEAVATKDYASLYPSSIIQKNMSHETMIEDEDYDNLENITYYNAQYKDSDGSIQYRRFAKIENKLGVIPTILSNLLKERKNIKKLMKDEKDPFKYKILDAKQLAVKITANSLYGQLGAPTSPVFKRDIAACTTSTGREMLILAKKYDEELLPWLMNGLKYYYKNNDMDKVNKLLDMELKARQDKELINSLKEYVTNDISNLTFQPVIRYGDTDSIFSCYRFRENTIPVSKKNALLIWKQVVAFARVLIEPFFPKEEKELFNKLFKEYYSDDKITSLELPEPPYAVPEPIHNQIILPIEERMKQFLKEYMQESYLPWLWTLTELVEKNYTNMFDIKLIEWAKHQLSKIRVIAEDLYQLRKNYLVKPILNYFEKDNSLSDLTNVINTSVWYDEVDIAQDKLDKLCKTLINKTIKDKWMYCDKNIKVINEYLELNIKNYMNFNKADKDKTIKLIIKSLVDYKTTKPVNLSEIVIDVLKKENIEFSVSKDNIVKNMIDCIEKYNVNSAKKSIDEIIEEFIQNDLKLDFNLYKNNHYNKVIKFVNNTMRKIDMTKMDKDNDYSYIWILPRWEIDDNNKKKYLVDIYEGGEPITDKRTLNFSMKMGELSGELVKSHLSFPHDLEYEKTFWPFAILSKKRYVGNKYEFNPDQYKLDFMGIVLKRRDNAPIVKEVCGGIIDMLINYRNPSGAISFTKKCLQDMFDGNYDIKYFLTSKNLKSKSSYKDWKKIAHVYLGEKIAQRDPGNAPQSGDRIEYAYIKVPQSSTKLLQGDMIETPKEIRDKNLELDYLFYLTNQIMNPALQFLELVDKDAYQIFEQFINRMKQPKIKKEKIVKDKVEKVKKEKPIKTKDNKKNIDTKKYILIIQDLINEITDYLENNKDDEIVDYSNLFLFN